MSDALTLTGIPPYQCACGQVLEHATSVGGGNVPEAGCVSVCFSCGALLTFNTDLTQREMTPEEIADLPAGLLQILARIEDARRAATSLLRRLR